MSNTRLGFSTPKKFNPISWIVRKFTKSRCSHTWFVYYDMDFEMDMVMEAHELGFRLIPYSRFEKHNQVVAIITPKTSLDAGLKWSAEWLGTAYDFAGLIGMAWVIIGRMLKKKWKNPLQVSHAMFCSEMAVTAMKKSLYPNAGSLNQHETSPEDLLDFLEAQEKTNGAQEAK